jgi:hypothetical protein
VIGQGKNGKEEERVERRAAGEGTSESRIKSGGGAGEVNREGVEEDRGKEES